MSSSVPTRSARRRLQTTTSSMSMPATGTSGQTSVAPMRGCSPLCCRMSMRAAASWIARKAASTTSAGAPTKVITVRLVSRPGSTSRSVTPSVLETRSAIARMTSSSRPSLKFGTHSMSGALDMARNSWA